MDRKSTATTLRSVSGPWSVLGILILIAAQAGCIGRDSKSGAELPVQNAFVNISEQRINTSDLQSNQLRLILRSKELNTTSMVTVTLQITNPISNETVITVFKPQFGQEWYNQTNITYIADNNWTQNFTIKRMGNISFVRMFVQVSEDSTVVRKAAWNITFGAPGGEPK